MKITLLRLPGANRQERTPLFTPAARSSASMPPAAGGGAARAALLTRSTPAARRVGVAGVAMLAALAALLSVSKPADAALSKMGAVDATTNFPSYYEDSTGLRLEPCLDGPPLCFAAPSDLKAPDGEAFYNNATAGPLTTGRVGGTTGKAVLVLAQEAAYAADGSGQEITFTRIRFTDSAGLTPGATYKVTHPFGTDSFVANASGAVPKNVGTEDIGGIGPCIGPNAHAAGGACDFGVSMTGRFGPFLKWDPAVAPAAPTGYLGDNATPHAIVGSPTGTNVFRIEGPNVNPTTTDQCPTVSGVIANCLETKLFTVEGKIAGPLLPSPSSLAFGSQPLGTQSATKTVTVKNVWATSITLRSVALDTASGDPTAFTIAPGGTCTVGKALARDATCTVNVQFTPTPTTAVGTRTATVLITHNGIRSPERIALTGSAATPGTAPAVGSLPASIAFADPQRLSTTSAPQDVTITNTGTADLNVAGVALGGKDATDFSAQNTCVGTAVAPGASCTVTVLFAPQQTGGAKTASLTITDDAPNSPRTIALTGTATVGLTGLNGINPFGFPTTYTDANGLTLQMCLDGPPNCLTAAADLLPPAGEGFYNNATSKITTRNGGKAVLVLSLEGAFAGSGANQQIVFSRIRFTDSGGLVPGGVYKVTHPFGVDTYKADSSGQVVKKAGTQDIGGLGPCTTTTAHNAGGVCDFAGAMNGRFGPFITWDPTVAPAAPVGFVGDAATDHAITGSPLGTNFFRIEGPGINPTPTVDQCPTVDGPLADCVQNNLFVVAGKRG